MSNAIYTTSDLEIWKDAATRRGLEIKKGDDDISEWFAQTDDDDTTMIGYFSKDWGMLT